MVWPKKDVRALAVVGERVRLCMRARCLRVRWFGCARACVSALYCVFVSSHVMYVMSVCVRVVRQVLRKQYLDNIGKIRKFLSSSSLVVRPQPPGETQDSSAVDITWGTDLLQQLILIAQLRSDMIVMYATHCAVGKGRKGWREREHARCVCRARC